MAAEELLRDGVFGVDEACRFAGISRSALYALMERGQLAFTKVGVRRLVPRRGLVALLAQGLERQSPNAPETAEAA